MLKIKQNCDRSRDNPSHFRIIICGHGFFTSKEYDRWFDEWRRLYQQYSDVIL